MSGPAIRPANIPDDLRAELERRGIHHGVYIGEPPDECVGKRIVRVWCRRGEHEYGLEEVMYDAPYDGDEVDIVRRVMYRLIRSLGELPPGELP